MSETDQDDTSIRKLTLGVLALCAFMLVWYLIADRYTPYTSQARVTGNIIPIVPRVSGEVVSVNVGVNQVVAAGDVLIQIDPSDYDIAVAQASAVATNEVLAYDRGQIAVGLAAAGQHHGQY